MTTVAGREVGPTGFGLLGFMAAQPPMPFSEIFPVLRAALSAGANFWNAAESYGTPDHNALHLLHAYFTSYPEDASKVVLSIRGAMNSSRLPDNRAENIDRSINECLRILDGVKTIDIFACARMDPTIPVEDMVASLALHVQAGRIGSIGLSETGADTIRRAAAIHPIASVEVEFSLFTTDICTNGVASACAQLEIPIVAYSPLGRGFLTGQIKSHKDVHPLRRIFPRFSEEHFDQNLATANRILAIAEKQGCKPAQLAIGWIRAHSKRQGWPYVIPIPGSTSVERVEENLTHVEIDSEVLAELGELLTNTEIVGARYPGALEALNFA